ncbi:MAG: glycoside hydrolase family 15 protein [Rhodospirillaceae bacterium]|nr:glycoside hydrolase family 15 protein [Rhodospirillaceae bacterium]
MLNNSTPDESADLNPRRGTPAADLNLGVIGNCAINALIDRRGCVQWSCMPRPDSQPVFNALLSGMDTTREDVTGLYDVLMENFARASQHYENNTAVLVTRLEDTRGQAIELVDFAPRFNRFGRRFRPMSIIRRIRPVAGRPRIKIRLRPSFTYGADAAEITRGSNHIRYVGPKLTLRLTTDAPLSYVVGETWFRLEKQVTLLLGPDEPVTHDVAVIGDEFQSSTVAYWRDWTRALGVPAEWQDAVIRAAITLKLCWFEETGGIMAAMTTSIPEAPDSGRTWDYRYCWLRDAHYVIRALNRISAIDIMESYLTYLRNLPELTDGKHLQPVYGLSLEQELTESTIGRLPGYRGMGPVRVGNQAYEHLQHDTYGQVILSASQAFFDRRLLRPMTADDFHSFEVMGERAYALAETPDAGLWELRTKARVHTYSSFMCWAACDRLARIATHGGLDDRARLWTGRAAEIREKILKAAWNPDLGCFVSTFGGSEVDASLLEMAEVGLVAGDDPRFLATIAAVEKKLKRGPYLFRYTEADDFGVPTTAFNICTFWYIDALTRAGRRDQAREIFEHMLARRNHVGLLSEDLDPKTGELWGNYPQTYSLVGIINAAMRLSRPWSDLV